MTLDPGARLGPFKVIARLGAGGMGEVYRARDTRLDRDVAIKVLLPRLAADEAAMDRFAREARAVAALNHPNIVALYDVGCDGAISYVVTELVTGVTLRERLAGGPLPLRKAIDYARQIAEALAAAHDRGIVHRDVKPENVFVTGDGRVKVLDFGLAQMSAAAVDQQSVAATAAQTLPGTVFGTVGYMAPEQVRAQAVDHRADLFALGAVIYEMVSGRRAFAGETAADVMTAVLHLDPPPLTADGGAAPAAETVSAPLERIVRRCLEKQPHERFQSARDLAFALDAIPLTVTDAAAPRAAPRPWPWMAAAAAVGAAAVGAAVLLASALAPTPDSTAPPAPMRMTIVVPSDTTLSLGRGSAVALSPDGRTLVFVGRQGARTSLYVRPLDRFEAAVLPGTDNATNPFFSPDGRWIGFFADGKLKKVSLDGGAPVAVADVSNPRGEAWSADDTIFVTASNNVGLARVPARGGTLEPYTSLAAGELSHRWPHLLPDGRTLLYAVWNDAGWELSRIVAQRADRAGASTAIIEAGGGYPRYLRDGEGRGYLVYARSEGLLAAPFDESALAVTGQATPVVDGVVTNLSGGAHFDLSRSGTLAYVPGAFGELERSLVWVTRDGRPATPTRTVRGLTRTWALSPDGTRVLRNGSGAATGGGDVWIEELAINRTTRVTSSPEQGNFTGVWSHDGRSVIFARGFANTDLFRRRIDGPPAEERLTSSPSPKAPSDVSRDGQWLAYYDIDPATGSDIWVLPLPSSGRGSGGGLPSPRPFVKTSANEGNATFSADGQWIAYQSNESGRFEIFVRSFPDGERVTRVSTDGGIAPRWSPQGRELFYRGLDNKLMVVRSTSGSAFEPGTPTALFDVLGYEPNIHLSPGGERLLMMPVIAAEQSATHVNVVLNFLTELRQRVR